MRLRIGWIATLSLACAASAVAQDAPLRLERTLVSGVTSRLRWEERSCDDASATIVRSLDATMTVTAVDRRGRPTALDFEVRSASDRVPVAAPGTRIHVERLSERTARAGHTDWSRPTVPDAAIAQTHGHLVFWILPYAFPDAPDRAWGTGRARAVGDSWSHRGIERREGLPVHRYRLPGTARVEAREDLDGTPVTHVVIDGAAQSHVPLLESVHRSHAEDVEETIELWVPDDEARPYPRVRVRRSRTVVSTTTETTRTTSAWCSEIRIEPIPTQ